MCVTGRAHSRPRPSRRRARKEFNATDSSRQTHRRRGGYQRTRLRRPFLLLHDGELAPPIPDPRAVLPGFRCLLRFFLLRRARLRCEPESAGIRGRVLLQCRDVRHGGLWGHASADDLRPRRRHGRDLHGLDVVGADHRHHVRTVLAAESPIPVHAKRCHTSDRRQEDAALSHRQSASQRGPGCDGRAAHAARRGHRGGVSNPPYHRPSLAPCASSDVRARLDPHARNRRDEPPDPGNRRISRTGQRGLSPQPDRHGRRHGAAAHGAHGV